MKNRNIIFLTCLFVNFATISSFAQLRVTTAGNVGVNTTSPNIASTGKSVTILGTGNSRGMIELKNPSPSSGGNTLGGIRFFNASTEGAVLDVITGTTSTTGKFVFFTKNAGGTNGARMLIDQDGNVGIGTTSPTYKLDVNGTTQCSGNIWTSDQMFKTNVDTLSNALAIIGQLKPRSYYFDTANVYGLNFPSKKRYGFLAQDLEEVLPELVASSTKAAVVDSFGVQVSPAVTYRGVYYVELIGILTKGIQELNTTVQSQQNQIQELQSQLASCCNSQQSIGTQPGTGNSVSSTGTPASGNGIADASNNSNPVLFQNVPNPFTEQTRIEYSIPGKFQSASIMIFDLNGKLVDTIPVSTNGKGSITINGNQLNPGMFVYSLIINGTIIDTKRMILTK